MDPLRNGSQRTTRTVTDNPALIAANYLSPHPSQRRFYLFIHISIPVAAADPNEGIGLPVLLDRPRSVSTNTQTLTIPMSLHLQPTAFTHCYHIHFYQEPRGNTR